MRPGDIVAGRFEAVSVAGTGGMGTVFRARDRLSGDHVALKVLRDDGKDVERFGREAVLLAELSHPAIVRYVAHGRTAAGELYLAMEWLDGELLSERLERAPLSLGEALSMVRRTADALGAAHARGVVHRDVKPSNLFLVARDPTLVKVLDFGVARAGHAAATQTRSGVVLGTPAYMAPEQARGERTVDARADVFALGCVLYECLAGRPPFAGEHLMGVLAKILLEEAAPVSELNPAVPAALADLTGRMLAKEAARRPADGSAVSGEIAALGSLDAPAWPPMSAPTSGLTAAEQRILSVLVVEGSQAGREGWAAPTMAHADAQGTLERLAATAQVYGARLEPLAGGAVVLLLSSGQGAPDQAERAARCGLALAALLPGTPIALATGRGRVAGRGPVGEVIDRATRLLRTARRAADAGATLRIDEVTAGLLGRRFEVGGDRAGLHLCADRGSPSLAPPSLSGRTVLGNPVPCVGRERELGVLTGTLEHAAREPVAQVALVTGEPGIGKSRLLEELRRAAPRHARSVEVWTARGEAVGAGSPFALVAELVRDAAALPAPALRPGTSDAVSDPAAGDPPEARRLRLRARVGRHLAEGEIDRVASFLGELTGVAFPDETRLELQAARRDPVLMGDQVRRAFEDLLEAECGAQPVLILLEDLQFGDLPSLKLLDAALRRLADRPWMIAAFARPEVHELFPRLWRERGVQELRLEALTRGASKRLILAAAPDLSDEVTASIVERAGGNPFYVEELVRAADAGGDTFPETVLAMVEARLDALEPEARRVLRAASVFGEVFSSDGVFALLGSAKKDAALWLEELERREVVVVSRERRPLAARAAPGATRGGSADHAFPSALVREAAYRALTEEDRRLGHRLAGEWLESRGETDAMTLAEHFERGGSPERARAWYRRAAEQALGGDDLEAVIARVERAAACGAEGAELGELRLLDAEARVWRGELRQASAAASTAMALLERGTAPWYRAAGVAGASASAVGDDQRIAEVSGELVELFAAGPPSDALYATAGRLVLRLLYSSRIDLAETLFPIVSAGEARATDPIAIAWIERALAARAKFGGDPVAYLGRATAALQAFRRAGDLRSVCGQGVAIGYAHLELGAHAEAEKVLGASLAEAERMGLALIAAQARQNLGLTLARLGRADEGVLALGRAVEAFESQGNRRMEAASRVYLAIVLCEGGSHADAERQARAAADASAALPTLRARALGVLAAALLGRGDVAGARETAALAAASLEELDGVEEGDVQIRLAHAEALHASGDEERARVAIARAREVVVGRAEKLASAEHRRRFLEAIPEHARTLALARAWLG